MARQQVVERFHVLSLQAAGVLNDLRTDRCPFGYAALLEQGSDGRATLGGAKQSVAVQPVHQ